ncbi:MAG: zinc finger MYND domain-containing protein [Verrucomicrobia bacterium]|nr:zinc finger MYND domain-containing protein [Verrucomicrobiota bacterium]
MSSVPSATSGSSSALPPMDMKVCEACKKTAEKMQVCSKCRFTTYCGVKCQRDDWLRHKNDCSKLSIVKLNSNFKGLGQDVVSTDQRIDAKCNEFASSQNLEDSIEALKGVISNQNDQIKKIRKIENNFKKMVSRMQPDSNFHNTDDNELFRETTDTTLKGLISARDKNLETIQQMRALLNKQRLTKIS